MFGEYQDARIKRNLKYVKVLSLIALILWGVCTFTYLFWKWYLYDWMISHPQDLSFSYICNFWGGEEFWENILSTETNYILWLEEIAGDILLCSLYFVLALETYVFSKANLTGYSVRNAVVTKETDEDTVEYVGEPKWLKALKGHTRQWLQKLSEEHSLESKRNNDFLNTLLLTIINLIPVAVGAMLFLSVTIAAMAGTVGNIASGVKIAAFHLGGMFPSHVFIIISSGFLIQTGVLIKREWKTNPPQFIIEEQQKAEEKRREAKEQAQREKAERDAATCKALLEECGMQFFIEYYPQLKRLPIPDINVSDHYFPEREARLTAAKKIVDWGLGERALRYIIERFGDIFSSEIIVRAKTFLEELKGNEGGIPEIEEAATENPKEAGRENKKGETTMKPIKAGEIIYAKTNAEFLNKLLGTHYRSWMKSYILWGDGEMLWMPRLDGVIRAGWRNTMQNGKIIEEYVGGRPYPDNINLAFEVRRRAVFEKCDAGGYFIFRGVFELEQGSSLLRRVLGLVSDEITL